MDANISGLDWNYENLKYVLERRDHWLNFLFSEENSGTPPSGRKIELKIRTFFGHFWVTNKKLGSIVTENLGGKIG